MAELIKAVGDEFMTPGEHRTAEYLKEKLPRSWQVICNKELVTNTGIAVEVDFIIIGDHRIFVVEEKSWRGRIHGDDSHWILVGGESRPSPLNKVARVSRQLAGRLRDNVPMLKSRLGNTHIVEGLTLLSDPSAACHINDPRRDKVLRLEGCEEELELFDRAGSAASLSPYRKGIIESLHLLPNRPKIPREINAYSIVEVLRAGPFYRSFLALHRGGGRNPERVLKVYQMKGPLGQELSAEQSQMMMREYQALQALGSLGVAAQVDPYFDWSDGEFLIVPYQARIGRTLREFYEEDDHVDQDFFLGFIVQAFNSLSEVHKKGILHRGLTPDCVHLTGYEPLRAAFSDFDFARVESDHTIAHSVDDLEWADPYRAPECRLGFEVASAASDVYSLALCFYEFLTGFDCQELDESVQLRPLTDFELRVEISSDLTKDVEEFFRHACHADDRKRFQSATEAAAIVQALKDRYSTAKPEPFPGRTVVRTGPIYEANTILDNRFRVVRCLGQGAFGTTYLVVDEAGDGGYYAAKCFHDALSLQRNALPEFKALKALHHPNLPKVYWVQDHHHQVHLVRDFVEGDTVSQLGETFPWPPERAVRIANELLDTLGYLAEHGIMHRDVGPRNIILGPDDRPFLIDFGLARLAEEVSQGTAGTPRYRPPEVDARGEWNMTADLYSIGVILFYMLTGEYPYLVEGGRIDKLRLRSPTEFDGNEMFESLLTAVLKAVGPNPADRYQTSIEFKQSLRLAQQATLQPEPDGYRHINAWVTSLRGLYRNSAIGNADNRGLDTPFAKDSYVATWLDRVLLGQIVRGDFNVVFLSGNPGDGKTAFLEKLRDAILASGGDELSRSLTGWVIDHNGRRFACNYDASQSFQGVRADQILDELFSPFAGSQPPTAELATTVLVAINDGKLRDFLLDRENRFEWLANQVREILEGDRSRADARITVVDLKRRSVVDGDVTGEEHSLFDRFVLDFLAPAHWDVCQGCRARLHCPIKFNADSLSDPVSGRHIRARLKVLVLASHLRGERHMTIRDLRSVLSYIISANLGCEEVHQTLETGTWPLDWHLRLYFNAVFNPFAENEDSLREFSLFDAGRVTLPRLDRWLHYNRRRPRLNEIENRLLKSEHRSHKLLSSLTYEALGDTWYQVTKRRVFFESALRADVVDAVDGRPDPIPEWWELLPYRHGYEFLRAVALRKGLDELCKRICQAISRSDGIYEESLDLPPGSLCISTAQEPALDFIVFKRFPATQFVLEVGEPPAFDEHEFLPQSLQLRHVQEDVSLEISLDLFEVLNRYLEGYLPGPFEQDPFVVDLQQFKNRVLLLQSDEVLLLEGGKQVHRIVARDGGIERIQGSIKQ